MEFKPDEYIGKKYGMLTILEFKKFIVYKRSRAPIFVCKCDCGNTKDCRFWDLKRSKTTSCGCIRRNLQSLSRGQASFNNLLRIYKESARKRNLIFDLELTLFKKLTQSNCYYCGSEPQNEIKTKYNTGNHVYNGLDRIDNSKGYIYNNVVSCCKLCNRAKSDLNLEDFISWINRLKNHEIKIL